MDSRQPNSQRLTLFVVLFVVLLCAVGGFLRYTIASSEQFWLDELHTGWVVGSTLDEVSPRAGIGNQAPLFFWMTWFARTSFDSPELSVRLVSMVASLLAIVFSSWFVWKWTRSGVGTCVVAVLTSIGVSFVQYGTEARPYAMLHLFGALHFAIFFDWIAPRSGLVAGNDQKRFNWIHCVLLAIVSAMLVYTHVTSISLFAAEFVLLVVVWVFGTKKPRGVILGLICAVILTGVICFPLIANSLEVFERRGNWAGVSDISRVWFGFRSDVLICLAVPLVALLVDRLFARGEKEVDSMVGNAPSNFLLVGVMLWAIVPIVALVVADLVSIPMALPRYAQIGTIAFPVFAAVVIGRLRVPAVKYLSAVLVLCFSVCFNPIVMFAVENGELPLSRFEDWKMPISQINAGDSKSEHPIFLFSNLIEDVDATENQDSAFQDYLKFPVTSIYPLNNRDVFPRPTMVFKGHFVDDDLEMIQQKGGAWVLVRAQPDFVDEIANEVSQLLTKNGAATKPVETRVLCGPDSDVYLISVDW